MAGKFPKAEQILPDEELLHSEHALPEAVFLNVYGSPGIDSKEWNSPAYVAWRAGIITLFLLGS